MDFADLVSIPHVLSGARRLARQPAVHFVLLGAVLATADAVWTRSVASDSGDGREIVLASADVALLRRGFELRYGAPPSPAEEHFLVERAIDEEVLYRRAIAIGLDRGNRVVRDRLVAAARMLADDPEQDDDSLHREALALGLDRTDIVVRRHLIQLMRLLIARSATREGITDADLEAALERRAEDHRLPARVTFRHVYFDPARRGAALRTDAEHALAELRPGRSDAAAAASLGDPFLLGARFDGRSDAEIRRLVGASFAAAVAEAPLGEWLGPLASGYGLHLVLVEERVAPRTPSVREARNQLVGKLLHERREESVHTRLAAMRQQYTVRIEPAAESRVMKVAAVGESNVLAVPRPPRELGD